MSLGFHSSLYTVLYTVQTPRAVVRGEFSHGAPGEMQRAEHRMKKTNAVQMIYFARRRRTGTLIRC